MLSRHARTAYKVFFLRGRTPTLPIRTALACIADEPGPTKQEPAWTHAFQLYRAASDFSTGFERTTAMTRHTHQTAPTQFVEANGIRFAYRRFGNPQRRAARDEHPLHRHDGSLGPGRHRRSRARPRSDPVQQRRHFQQLGQRAGIDRGDGGQRGRVHRGTRTEAGRRARLFDGRPDRAGTRDHEAQAGAQLILVGTGPRSGEGMASLTPEAQEIFSAIVCASRPPVAARALRAFGSEPGGGTRLSSNASVCATKTAIPKPTTRSRPRNSPRSRSGARRARTRMTIWRR